MLQRSAERDRALRDKGRIPLVIGVTGHRCLPKNKLPELRKGVRAALEARKALVSKDTPLVLMSSLAAGADQLVAEVARSLGFDIVAPLPLEVEDYAQDFPTGPEREAFHRAVKQSDCFVVPEDERLSAVDGESARDLAYLRAGLWIARHSHVLLALYDGKSAQGTGGTADVVRSVLMGEDCSAGPLRTGSASWSDRGVVDHILVARFEDCAEAADLANAAMAPEVEQSAQGSGAVPLEYPVETRFPDLEVADEDELQEAHAESLRLLDGFNARVCTAPDSVTEGVHTECVGAVSAQGLSGVDDPLRIRFAWADRLAMSAQRERWHTLRIITGSSFLAVTLYTVYDTFIPEYEGLATAALVANGVLLAVALAFFVRARLQGVERDHIDYRALAEGLRVQLAWRDAGLPNAVADHCDFHQVSEMSWVRTSLRIAHWRSCVGCVAEAAPDPAHLCHVWRTWMKSQEIWFRRAFAREGKKVARNTIWLRCFFGAGVLLFASVIWTQFAMTPTVKDNRAFATALLGLGMVITFALATAIELYSDKTVLTEQHRQYSWGWSLFRRASHDVKMSLRAQDLARAQQQCLETGKTALIESSLWHLHHRSRPMPAPTQ